MLFDTTLQHLDRAIDAYRLDGGNDSASMLMLEIVRRDLIGRCHPNRTNGQSYFYTEERGPLD